MPGALGIKGAARCGTMTAGVAGAGFASFLWDGCDPGQLEPQQGIDIVNFVTTPVLMQTLQCRGDSSKSLATLEETYPEVGEYQESLD